MERGGVLMTKLFFFFFHFFRPTDLLLNKGRENGKGAEITHRFHSNGSSSFFFFFFDLSLHCAIFFVLFKVSFGLYWTDQLISSKASFRERPK